MRSKILKLGAGLAAFAIVGWLNIAQVRAELSASSDPAATSVTGPLDVRINMTVASIAILALQGQADGTESGGNLITYSFTATPLGVYVTGASTPSYTLVDAGGAAYYFYDTLGAYSAGSPSTVSAYNIEVTENVSAAGVTSGFAYSGRQTDTSTWTVVTDSTHLSVTPVTINSTPITPNTGYCGQNFTTSLGAGPSSVRSCDGRSDDLDRADGAYMPLSAVSGSTRATVIEYALIAS